MLCFYFVQYVSHTVKYISCSYHIAGAFICKHYLQLMKYKSLSSK